MDPNPANRLGVFLKKARRFAGLSQAALAEASQLPRLRVVRIENGQTTLRLDEAIRVASVLKVPLELLADGSWRPNTDLRGIAFELYHLGIRDLEVSGAQVVGAFRAAEQVVAAAVKGDKPEPRVVEAMPTILARRRLNVPLTVAFADSYDPRVRRRLAWLSDVTLTLSQLSYFPVEVKWESQLAEFVQAGGTPGEPDSLGHPREGRLPPLWSRWHITYAAEMSDFIRRAQEVETAYQTSESMTEPGE
jgi:transcriptional regulator with XRE-family HTH domain